MKKIDLENLKFNNEKMSEEMLKEINGGCDTIRIVYCSSTGYKYVWGKDGCDNGCISDICKELAIETAKRIDLRHMNKFGRGNFRTYKNKKNGTIVVELISNG